MIDKLKTRTLKNGHALSLRRASPLLAVRLESNAQHHHVVGVGREDERSKHLGDNREVRVDHVGAGATRLPT